jgi:hypothetical protein
VLDRWGPLIQRLKETKNMKNSILKTLKFFIDFLSIQYTKLLTKTEINLPYISLSPTDNAEEVDDYLNALEWALNKRDKIKNIAIAGPYGAGKSSIINTFRNKYKSNNDYKFLHISLATFKDEKNNETTIPENKKDDLLRLIELSILQQLFYHEKDTKIPDSRFKKIKIQKNSYSLMITIGLLIFTTSFLHIVFPDFLAKFYLKELPAQNSIIFHYISVLIVAFGVLLMVYSSIRTLKRLSVKKLGINNASIEIDDKISKSILNNHIDEILYFFEVTKYNIVIIEDLDRFEQTDVFTKLREINLLINNSKKIENDVVFIYAIRDDMFQDKDRTKFFDFMIPVIPVINSSNSNDKLLKIIELNKYKISESLVDDISLFIDDMRLLYNIMNEYHVYFKKLNESLSQDKLLAMIVYKNIYPNDFTKLSQNDGALYLTITNRYQYIIEKTSETNNQIKELKNKIEKLENAKLNSTKELRMIYIYKIIEKINNSFPFHSFIVNYQNVSLPQALEDDNFVKIINAKSIEYNYNNNNNTRSIRLDFTSIEKEINPELTYDEREELILNGDKIEELKKSIEKLEVQKNEIKKYKVKDLISKNHINLISEKQNQKELISLLLRNGYIDEDYLDYISIFYEGSLSKNDHQFLMNVKTQSDNEFDFPLQKKENLIKKINSYEFDKPYILNFDLLDFIIADSNYPEIRKKYFMQLSSETDYVIKFIDGFVERTSNIENFIKHLCNEWSNIWNFIAKKSFYTDEKQEQYFKLIIEHAEVNDIEKIFANSLDKISNHKDFLSIITNKEKLKQVIKELDIKFSNIHKSSSPKGLLDYVYSNNYYAINIEMVKFVFDEYIKADTYEEIFDDLNDFETKNYSAIKRSKLENLINYVNDNINEYVTAIYLNIDTNTDEETECYIELLNNMDMSKGNKEKIIRQVKTRINDISVIDDFSIVTTLLKESKMLATWANHINIYIASENVFTKEMTSFINYIEHAKELSNIKIKTDYPDEETAKSFLKSLLLNDGIETESYSYVLSSIPYIYNSLDFENLSSEKVRLLIGKNILTTNNTNFKLLKQYFKDLSIPLIENNLSNFILKIDTFDIENEDLVNLMKSNSISVKQKEQIIDKHDAALIHSDPRLLTQIGKLLLDNNNMRVGNEMVLTIGVNSNLTELDKIRLFNKWNRIYQKEDISNFLISLDKPYSSIAENGKRPLLEDSELNRELAENLKNKEYISKYEFEQGILKGKGIRISTFRYI